MQDRRNSILLAGLCLLALILLWRGNGNNTEAAAATCEEEPVSILAAADLHYLSPQLTDGGEMFRQVIEAGDGKVMERDQRMKICFILTGMQERC